MNTKSTIKDYLSRKLDFLWLDIKTFYYEQISSRICPRQRWLAKKIPKTHCDETELIKIVLFEIMVHFVEEEKCFESIDFYHKDENWPGQAEIGDKIKEIYNYIKVERPKLLEKFNKSYPVAITKEIFKRNENGHLQMLTCEEMYGKSFEEAYGEHLLVEAEIESLDKKYLTMIAGELREYLWV